MKKSLFILVTFCSLIFTNNKPIQAQSGPNPTPITQWTSGGYEIRNPNGSFLMGPLNNGWCHMYTDRPAFIFNKAVHTMGGMFSSYYLDNLYLQTGGTTRLTINNATGNVGVGIDPGDVTFKIYNPSLPTFELSDGSTRLNIYVNNGQVIYRALGMHQLVFHLSDDNNDGNSFIQFSDDANGAWFKIFNNRIVRIDGKLLVKDLEVNPDVYADDVFTKGYKLMSIQELEKYINTNHHLPSVPTEAEVKEKGMNVGDMNVILLRKVEELTKYVLELNKKIEELQTKAN